MTVPSDIEGLVRELTGLREAMLMLETEAADQIAEAHPAYTESARNLVHYLALRRRDIRELQTRLAELGLSSLGRAEAHVLQNVEGVLRLVRAYAGMPPPAPLPHPPATMHEGRALLDQHTRDLLGAPPAGRRVRIMVTFSTEAAYDRALVRSLLDAGMDCARINCAHDDPDVWARMIENLRIAEQDAGWSCPVAMDVAGPKLRTGPVGQGAEVVRVGPARDDYGHVIEPARVWLSAAGRRGPAPSNAAAAVPVAADWLVSVRPGDDISFVDTRGAKRTMTVTSTSEGGAWAETQRTAYIGSGTVLVHEGRETSVGRLAAREHRIALCVGDHLVLTREPAPGTPAVLAEDGTVVAPARISCTLPEVFERIRPGDRVYLDDGRIGGVVRHADADSIRVDVTRARPQGERLGGDKGINLPDTDLRMPALTDKDCEDLEYIARSADIVNYSFVHEPSDIDDLERRLAELGAHDLGVVLKIETVQGFRNLPNLLLAAMRAPRRGIMIARGDLAVECGFERLAEVQEEILWLSEAAHIPVIWATQVLEQLAKSGAPSRAEITDAAMSNRAECVMLNKGPHIVLAVQVLDNILRRMAAHQSKKSAMLRPLDIARSQRR